MELSGHLFGGAALALAFGNSLWGWIFRGRVKAANDADMKRSTDEATAAVETQATRILALEKAFVEHKIKVAETYVSLEMLEHTEGRIMSALAELSAAIRGLTDRIDRAHDRVSVD